MEEKNIPRRMKRFYRQGKQPPSENYQKDSYDPGFGKASDFGNIPTMGYEDLEKNMSDENKKEIQRLEQGDLEQKLALFEVEKFKKKNKRLPNKKESQQMADTLYNQFKDDKNLLSEKTPSKGRRDRRKSRKRMPPSKRKRMGRDGAMQEQAAQNEAIAPKKNIKDLFGPSEMGGKSIADEFKLNLGENEKSDDLGELSELENEDDFSLDSMDEQQTCPSCNKKTDKIIYCSKCGAAFCEKCGKEKCPKCGVAVKS